jgi:hypothetical protein
MRATYSAHLIVLDLISLAISGADINYESPLYASIYRCALRANKAI